LDTLQAESVAEFRIAVAQWVQQYQQTSVLLLIKGDVHADTGELVYIPNNSGGHCHAPIDAVFFFLMLDLSYWMLISG